MLGTDKDALICDMAQTYHIFDLQAVPVPLLSTLAVGLDNGSRIKRRMAGAKLDIDTALRAAILDRLTTLVWMRTKDGAKNRNRPKSVLDALTEEKQIVTYKTVEAFETARRKILERFNDG